MTIYDVGDKVTATTLVLVNDVPTDATVVATVTSPAGAVTTPSVAHTGLGAYSTDVTTTLSGDYLIHWTISGTATGVDEYQFYVQPPGFRAVSVTDAKNHINKSTTFTGDDNELRGFIETAGEIVDSIAGPTVNRTIVEYHNGGQAEIFLRYWPAVSITTVVETWPGGPNHTLNQLTGLGLGAGTGYDFTFNPNLGSICRRVNDWASPFAPGLDNVKVTYVMGRAQPWPGRIRMAALEEVAYLWRSSQTGRGAGRAGNTALEETLTIAGIGAVPLRVVQLLAGLARPPQSGA
jgi:hypothetical protein